MKTIFTTIFGISLAFSAIFTASAQTDYSYTQNINSYRGNNNICTMDAYTCPNGTTVGRTGYNCQFVCSGTGASIVNNSYSYTSGCYTYYYNGYTRKTSVTSYNCQNNYQTNYTYTQPYYQTNYTYTQPYYQNSYYYTSPSYTYQYSDSSWYPSSNCNNYNNSSYYYNTGCTNTGYDNNNYNYGYNNPYQTGCYLISGYQVCY